MKKRLKVFLIVFIVIYTVIGNFSILADNITNYESLNSHSDIIPINIMEVTSSNDGISIQSRYNGRNEDVILLNDKGEATWNFEVWQDGEYYIKLQYFPIISKNADAEIEIKIDGEYPFDAAKSIILKKLYKSFSTKKRYDNNGNEIQPERVQTNRMISDYLKGFSGKSNGALVFDLTSGKHSLSFTAKKDEIAIVSISLEKVKAIKSYNDYKAINQGKIVKSDKLIVQAEDALYTTASLMVPVNDRTSPLTVPTDAYNIFYNTFGGSGWNNAGDYAIWEFDVKESGYYKIGIKFRQNGSVAILPSRRIFIDGEIPFKDFDNVMFQYSRDWQYKTLKAEKEVAYIFLSEGKHTLRIESSLGLFNEIFSQIEEVVHSFNDCYRNIIMITGTSPDTYRDYQLDVKIPYVIDKLKSTNKELIDCVEAFDKERIGNKETTEILTLIDQVNDFVDDSNEIPKRLQTFKTNIGALSDWLITAKQRTVEFDYFVISGKNCREDKVKANFFEKMIFEFKALLSSFINDYNSMENNGNYRDTVDVWITSGRDQANILKAIIDANFVPTNKINTNLKLVQGTSLLSAIIADKGPDVAMGLSNSDPVNYALRNAIIPLSDFDGFDAIKEEFYPSAIEPFTFQGVTYALPETQSFSMLFYRKDILSEIGLTIPKTWNEVKNCLTELANINMEFGINSSDTASALNTLGMLLYQNGGSFYIDDNKASGLSSEIAMESFKDMTSFYNNYGLPYTFDALNRFRTGEMPILISDYTLYNRLCVSAPEINGLWGVTVVPGTIKEDGSVDNSVMGTVTGTVITKSAKNPESAWKFLKWWLSSETQAEFGLKIENLLGRSARYATANIKAFDALPWSNEELIQLKEQWKSVVAIPEIPGSYFTPRHLFNAFRRVMEYDDDPRQTLLDYTQYINKEIETKRDEFGLS